MLAIKINENDNILDISYNPGRSKPFLLDKSPTAIFEIKFEVKHDLGFDDTVISAKADLSSSPDFASSSCINLDDLEINIQSNRAEDICKLRSLVPSAGRLAPAFNPNVYEYTIDVGCDEKYLDFDALPVSENLTVRINRRKLCAAGKSVNINVSVSSKKPREKMIYTVQVNRAAKPETPKKSKSAGRKAKTVKEKKSKSKKRGKKSPESSSNADSEISDEETDSDNENDAEEITLEDENLATPEKIKNNSVKNDNSKIYLYSALALAILAPVGYYIFIKIKKRREKTTDDK